MERAQRTLCSPLVAVDPQPVALVVAPDVLERRDADRELERTLAEGELPDVGERRAQPGNLGLREVDADELGCSERDETREVGRLGEGVADVEHARLAAVAGKTPGDLDHPLVGARRPRDSARPLVAQPGAGGEGERVVEQRHVGELGVRDELVEEPSARKRAVAELRERALPGRGLGIPAQHEPPELVDELLVTSSRGGEPGRERRVHGAPLGPGPGGSERDELGRALRAGRESDRRRG